MLILFRSRMLSSQITHQKRSLVTSHLSSAQLCGDGGGSTAAAIYAFLSADLKLPKITNHGRVEWRIQKSELCTAFRQFRQAKGSGIEKLRSWSWPLIHLYLTASSQPISQHKRRQGGSVGLLCYLFGVESSQRGDKASEIIFCQENRGSRHRQWLIQLVSLGRI